MEEEKENRNFMATAQQTLSAQQMSGKLHLSSVSSLRTYVDPACAGGASPRGGQAQNYPEAGLFSNLAFSNFYTSTDESDIDAALNTARHQKSNLTSSRFNGQSIHQMPNESEEEAPISGLNHLGEYLVSMRRLQASSGDSEATEQRQDLLILDSEAEEAANLEARSSPLLAQSNVTMRRQYLTEVSETDFNGQVVYGGANKSAQPLEQVAMEIPAGQQTYKARSKGRQVRAYDDNQDVLGSQAPQINNLAPVQQLSQQVLSEKSKQSAVSLFRNRLKSIGSGSVHDTEQCNPQHMLETFDNRAEKSRERGKAALAGSCQRQFMNARSKGSQSSPPKQQELHLLNSLQLEPNWPINKESSSRMLLGGDLERTILTQSSFLKQRPHQNSVWRVADIDDDVNSSQEKLVKRTRSNHRQKSGVNTESNHIRRRRELSNALLGRRGQLMNNVVASSSNDGGSQSQSQARQAGSEGVPHRRPVLVLPAQDPSAQMNEVPIPYEDGNYFLFKQFAQATGGSINMLIQTDLTSLSKSSMAGATTVVAATVSGQQQPQVSHRNNSLSQQEQLKLSMEEDQGRLSSAEADALSARSPPRSVRKQSPVIQDSLEKESKGSVVDQRLKAVQDSYQESTSALEPWPHPIVSLQDPPSLARVPADLNCDSIADSIGTPSQNQNQSYQMVHNNGNSSFYNTIDMVGQPAGVNRDVTVGFVNQRHVNTGQKSSVQSSNGAYKGTFSLAQMINQSKGVDQNSSQHNSFGGAINNTGQKTGSFPKREIQTNTTTVHHQNPSAFSVVAHTHSSAPQQHFYHDDRQAIVLTQSEYGFQERSSPGESLIQALEQSQVTPEHFKNGSNLNRVLDNTAHDRSSSSPAYTQAHSSETKAGQNHDEGNLQASSNVSYINMQPQLQSGTPSSQVSPCESKETTPFSKKTPQGTCVKVHKGEYRYSSSPLGKRIDIYQSSETEEDCISSLQSQLAAKKTLIDAKEALKEEKDEEEDPQQARIPTLCTFDVRDKKTTFQTSCYVKRDIVQASEQPTTNPVNPTSLFGGAKPNQPHSRNAGRHNKEGTVMPFGLKSTLLQDSLNSVLSTKRLLVPPSSTKDQSLLKKSKLGRDGPNLSELSILLEEKSAFTMSYGEQATSVEDLLAKVLRENAELTKKNEVLEERLEQKDQSIAELSEENKSLKTLVTEQKVQIRQYELGAQGFKNCLETQSNCTQKQVQSTSKSAQRSNHSQKNRNAAASGHPPPVKPIKRMTFPRPATQMHTQPQQQQPLLKHYHTKSSGRDSSVPLLTLPTQSHAQSYQSLPQARMSHSTLPAAHQLTQDPYSELLCNQRTVIAKQTGSFDCRKVIPNQPIRVNNIKNGTRQNIGGEKLLKAQKKRLNFDHQGLSGYQIASLRIKGCNQSEVNLTRNYKLDQAQSTGQLRVLHTSISGADCGAGTRMQTSCGERQSNENDLCHSSIAATNKQAASQERLTSISDYSNQYSLNEPTTAIKTKQDVPNHQHHYTLKTMAEASQLTEIKKVSSNQALVEMSQQKTPGAAASDLSNVGLSGGDYSPISHTFFKRPGDYAPEEDSLMRGGTKQHHRVQSRDNNNKNTREAMTMVFQGYQIPARLRKGR